MKQTFLDQSKHHKLFFFWNFNLYNFYNNETIFEEFYKLKCYYPSWYPGWWGSHKKMSQNHVIYSVLFFTSLAQPPVTNKNVTNVAHMSSLWYNTSKNFFYTDSHYSGPVAVLNLKNFDNFLFF